MSPMEETVLISLSLLFVWIGSYDAIHARIGKYPGVSDAVNCGKGRLTSLMASDNCMKWHKSDDMNARIINGRDISAGEMNFVAFIESVILAKNPNAHGRYRAFYNGAIVSDNWVVTSATAIRQHQRSCQQYNTTHDCYLIVYAGLHNSSYSSLSNNVYPFYIVDQIYNHPDHLDRVEVYKGKDLALLKLDGPFTFGNRLTVNTVCLPEENIINSGDELAVFAGWGYRSSQAIKGAEVLQTAVTRIIAGNKEWDLFRDTIMATLMRPTTGASTCIGDLGSPLIQYVHGRVVLIGIITKPFYAPDTDVCIKISELVTMTWCRVSMSVDWIVRTILTNK